MNKHLPTINLGLILLIIVGLWGLGSIWLTPLKLDFTAESDLKTAPQILQVPKIDRKRQGRDGISLAAQHNLFRKERREYPIPQANAGGQVAQLSLISTTKQTPSISLKGVILLNGTKIAILNGTRPTRSSASKGLPIKSKGYKIGDSVGSYRVSAIDINSVTLNAPSGKAMTLQLAKRSPDQTVQKTGNQLFHKGDASYLTQPVAKAAPKVSLRTAASRTRTSKTSKARARSRSRSRGAGIPQIPIMKPNPNLIQNPPIKYPPQDFQIPGFPTTTR